jgi:hypothetical protein
VFVLGNNAFRRQGFEEAPLTLTVGIQTLLAIERQIFETEVNAIIPSTADSVAEVEFVEADDSIINGFCQYGYGMWTKWMRTAPTYLAVKAPWHSLSRLTQNRNHKDATMGDRTLAIWIGAGYYHFTAYSLKTANNIMNVEYENHLDGEWNYIHFGYNRTTTVEGNAMGWVYFS